MKAETYNHKVRKLLEGHQFVPLAAKKKDLTITEEVRVCNGLKRFSLMVRLTKNCFKQVNHWITACTFLWSREGPQEGYSAATYRLNAGISIPPIGTAVGKLDIKATGGLNFLQRWSGHETILGHPTSI